jgi:4-hydroxybenzoate polyprenyltransferase
MLPKWRRLRIAATVFTLLVAVGLVALAFAAPPSIPSKARGLLIILAIVLPVGFYGVFTITGWHRSADAGVTPPPMVARMLKSGLGPVAPLLLMFMLIGLMTALNNALGTNP